MPKSSGRHSSHRHENTRCEAAGTPVIDAVQTSAFTIRAEERESDGTADWSATNVVVAQIHAGGAWGLGYTYAVPAAAEVIAGMLGDEVRGRSAMDIPRLWTRMVKRVRNAGRAGVCAMAISAVDNALWDLKARLLNLPLIDLLGAERDAAPIYGSGGFTSLSVGGLARQLAGWTAQGIPRVKMKIGREPERDPARVAAARRAIGHDAQLFVDANGAYSARRAAAMARRLSEESDIAWFEEPVSSDDVRGMCFVRRHAPDSVDIAAGEYLWDPWQAASFLREDAVDCLQLDATRCCGITGYLRAAAAADAMHIPVSTHCAPQLHAHVACATPRLRHVEYFHDHVRAEGLLFDGVLEPEGGALRPDRARPGIGLHLKEADAEAFRMDQR